jgi:hypothetical protein
MKKHRLLKGRRVYTCFLGAIMRPLQASSVKMNSCLLIVNRKEQDITYYIPAGRQNTSEVILSESVGSSVQVPRRSAVILKKEYTR